MHTLELSQIDTRYASLRLKNPKREKELLASIIEKGILEPLYVIKEKLLVDGNKRYRCAKRLNMESVPVTVLDTGEVPGLIKFIKLSNNKGLSQIEQACLVDELHKRHNLAIPEIADHLERSVSWVRMRLGILENMDDAVRESIMTGKFPFRSYMYVLKKHTRVQKNNEKEEVPKFVEKVSGQGFSTRNIEILTKGYFSGNAAIKEQISRGKFDWTLEQLKQQEKTQAKPNDDMNESEVKALSQLKWAFVYINRLPAVLSGGGFESPAFFKKSAELSGNILKRAGNFIETLKEFYDKSRKANGGIGAASKGKG